jgi:hypothetical protein
VRKTTYKILTRDENEALLAMYRRRLKLLNEAEQYSIENLARRFGCSKNTVWARTCGLSAEPHGEPDSYTERLIKENAALQQRIEAVKATCAKILTKVRIVEGSRDTLTKHLYELGRHARDAFIEEAHQ